MSMASCWLVACTAMMLCSKSLEDTLMAMRGEAGLMLPQ